MVPGLIDRSQSVFGPISPNVRAGAEPAQDEGKAPFLDLARSASDTVASNGESQSEFQRAVGEVLQMERLNESRAAIRKSRSSASVASAVPDAPAAATAAATPAAAAAAAAAPPPLPPADELYGSRQNTLTYKFPPLTRLDPVAAVLGRSAKAAAADERMAARAGALNSW
jgi:hypothetical protein